MNNMTTNVLNLQANLNGKPVGAYCYPNNISNIIEISANSAMRNYHTVKKAGPVKIIDHFPQPEI